MLISVLRTDTHPQIASEATTPRPLFESEIVIGRLSKSETVWDCSQGPISTSLSLMLGLRTPGNPPPIVPPLDSR